MPAGASPPLAPGLFASELARQRAAASADLEAARAQGDATAEEDALARLADLDEIEMRSTGPIVLPDMGVPVPR